MIIMNYQVFNPCNHQDDIVNAFIGFIRKFVYDGENWSPPANINTDELQTDCKDKDKACLFMSRAVSIRHGK